MARSVLGKYETRAILGRGAMGIVYDGWDPVIARRVAIKTIALPEVSSSDGQDQLLRFRREAQAAGRLNHPNIITVHDYGETDGFAYLVMEFVDGKDVISFHKERMRLDPGLGCAEAVRLVRDLLAALQYSHDHGVVHRDVKPANVLVTAAGQVKIGDFGIARIGTSDLTQAGTLIGTPAYMSPEQLTGQAADARSDVYAVGILLYQLLTGEKPFDGSLASIMHKALNTRPPRPSALSLSVPPGLDSVVERAMARRPDDRFTTAAEFSEALGAAFAGRAGRTEETTATLGSEPDATVVQTAPPRTAAVEPTDGVLVRSRRLPVLLAKAVGLAVVLVIGGVFLISRGEQVALVAGPAFGPPPAGMTLAEAILALVALERRAGERDNVNLYTKNDMAHRALAISPKGGTWWSADSSGSSQGTVDVTLERCELFNEAPCATAAVDGMVRREALSATPMPRLAYAGLFDQERIPGLREPQRTEPDVGGYRSAPSPKAMAIHPWGYIFVAIAGPDPIAVQAQALSACNLDPKRKGRDGPCYLYAVGDQVVLPQRLVAAPAGTTAPVPATDQDQVLARFVSEMTGVVAQDRDAIARRYLALGASKALALAPDLHGSWRSGPWPTSAIAEEKALEGCQVMYNSPCLLYARDDILMASLMAGEQPRRDMPRVHYAGVFDPAQIPSLPEGTRSRADVANYKAAPRPKAMAYHPWGRVFVATGGASSTAVQEQVLSVCNADPDRKNKSGPCYLYAVDDQVVLPQRLLYPAGIR